MFNVEEAQKYILKIKKYLLKINKKNIEGFCKCISELNKKHSKSLRAIFIEIFQSSSESIYIMHKLLESEKIFFASNETIENYILDSICIVMSFRNLTHFNQLLKEEKKYKKFNLNNLNIENINFENITEFNDKIEQWLSAYKLFLSGLSEYDLIKVKQYLKGVEIFLKQKKINFYGGFILVFEGLKDVKNFDVLNYIKKNKLENLKAVYNFYINFLTLHDNIRGIADIIKQIGSFIYQDDYSFCGLSFFGWCYKKKKEYKKEFKKLLEKLPNDNQIGVSRVVEWSGKQYGIFLQDFNDVVSDFMDKIQELIKSDMLNKKSFYEKIKELYDKNILDEKLYKKITLKLKKDRTESFKYVS
ncbi:MAG: hypothetical protein PVG30_02625 [Gammaproteobacteria bacterium]|jgi:hypothetical protein